MLGDLGKFLDLLPDPASRAIGLAIDGADFETVFASLEPYLVEVESFLTEVVRGYQLHLADSLGGDAAVWYDLTTSPEGRAPLLDWLNSLAAPEGSEDWQGLLVVIGIEAPEDLLGFLVPLVGIVVADQILVLWRELAVATGLDTVQVGSWTGSMPDPTDPEQGGLFVVWMLSMAPQIVASILNLIAGLRVFLERHYNELQGVGEVLAGVGSEAFSRGINQVFRTFRQETPGGGLPAVVTAFEGSTSYPPELETDTVVLRLLLLAPAIR